MATESESHQLNKELPNQEILIETPNGEQYLVNLEDDRMAEDEQYYDNQVSNCEVI